jgi:hypothetical protein
MLIVISYGVCVLSLMTSHSLVFGHGRVSACCFKRDKGYGLAESSRGGDVIWRTADLDLFSLLRRDGRV